MGVLHHHRIGALGWHRIGLVFVGGVVAAAVGGGASSSDAESVSARNGEIIAREAPGSGQAGVAVLRGSDRVQLTGERDGWSEILLPDGRRAWVPSTEITRIGNLASARTPLPTESPLATGIPLAATATDDAREDLVAEVERLRVIVDELAAWRATALEPARGSFPYADDLPWLVAAAALVVGLMVGGAWERHRGRRDRALKF